MELILSRWAQLGDSLRDFHALFMHLQIQTKLVLIGEDPEICQRFTFDVPKRTFSLLRQSILTTSDYIN